CAFDLLAGALGEAMGTNVQLNAQVRIATQDHNRLLGVLDEASLEQTLRRNVCSLLEGIAQRLNADFLVFDAEDIVESAFEGQAPHQGKFSAFKVRGLWLARTRLLAFGTTASCLALPGRDTTPDAALTLVSAGVWF